MQAIADDNKSDEDFDKLKDESKEKDSPKKVKPAVKRTPKVWELKLFFDYLHSFKYNEFCIQTTCCEAKIKEYKNT